MQKIKDIIPIPYFAVIVIAILLTGCQSKDSTDTDTNTENVSYDELKVGDTAPDFEVELLSGESVKLSDYQGKAVLLNFWATWCSPCVAEMPEIEALSEDYANDVVVLAVNCNEKRDTVNDFIQEKGYTFLIGMDENQEITKKYPTDGIPYTVVIDGDGIISALHLGGGKGMYSVFEEDLKAILSE